MNKDKLYNEFEDLAVKLGMRIIKGKGDFKGGACILKDEKIIVVNKRKPMEQKLKVLASCFNKIERVFSSHEHFRLLIILLFGCVSSKTDLKSTLEKIIYST